MQWLKGSEYHTVSECKRFAIARVNVLGRVRFEAYRTPTNVPAVQIDVIELGDAPTNEQRSAAVSYLKQRCEEYRA